MTRIRLEGITKLYGSGSSGTAAVVDVSLDIASGEFFFLLGPSGCGKTTLLRIVAGLLAPTAGEVMFGDRNITNLPAEKRNAAMVFQNYALWPHMTVLGNVEFAPKMRGVGRAQRRRLADEHLTRVQMAGYARRKPNQLSGGQQQRVAVARALAAGADCLLLDEPLSNLDARLRLQMRTELRRLVKSSGATGIYVTHDQTEALSMADRVAVMNEGRIVQVAAPQQLYDRPATRFVADFLGEANFIDGRLADSGPPARIDTPLGELLTSEAAGAVLGAEVACCVRPERIAISSGPRLTEKPHGSSSFPACVESSTYLGGTRQYVCALGPTGRIVRWKVSVLADSSGGLDSGQQVVLSIAPKDVAIVKR